MSGEGDGLKLFNNKPKKPKSNASTPISTAAAPPPPPPPKPRQESFIRRYKFLWPLLLGVNFVVGAYVLLRTRQKDETPETASSTSTSSSAPPTIAEQAILTPSTVKEPVQRAPIPVDQQREVFKWILEEKRKMKPKDAEEKKRIDEEKAILKQFIRAKSIPTI